MPFGSLLSVIDGVASLAPQIDGQVYRGSRGGLDPQHRAVLFIRQKIEQPIGMMRRSGVARTVMAA